VKVSGVYRLVRHPMYAGYLLVHIGNMLLFPSVFNLVLYGIGWWAQILRLLAEEALLSQDEAYRAYQAKVRWRLLPGLF
jgi:protein-S-isoprenylcysteine O-methyltransferase Ste14